MEFDEIKGFGKKRTELMQAAGFSDPAALLSYFPSRYYDTNKLSDLAAAKEGDFVLICAATTETPKVAYVRKNLKIVKIPFNYDGKKVYCSWFNQPYMAKNVVVGKYYYVGGKLKKFKSAYEIVAPTLIPFGGSSDGVIPVYKPIGKVSGKLIAEAVSEALRRVKVEGYVPRELEKKHGLIELNDAVRQVHKPSSLADADEAKRSIAIEKLAYKLCAFSLVKSGDDKPFAYADKSVEIERAERDLPYELTPSQKRAAYELIAGMNSRKKMNSLFEGDVGSGKTVVAFLAMYYAALNGYQAALMCPTELLARQHYRKAVDFFEGKGVKCAFLSGSVVGGARKSALDAIASGEAGCVFGTHALLGDEVEFNALSLVVIDEQHRFGVAQRGRLENKSSGADCVVTSATPIPRTLALTLYGELGTIIIDDVPARKAKTTTRFVSREKEDAMWRYVSERAAAGEQTFAVVPRISGDEEDETFGAEELFALRGKPFGREAALLHGKMKEADKTAVMNAFAAGEIKVLIATTVVEVGIDVPQATTMIIYGADRFGLSQLHQLRGRVGRGTKDSYCFVLSDNESDETRARIDYFVKNSDGFALAEYDYRVRGGGDFIGESQHGGSDELTPETVSLASRLRDEILAVPSAVEKIAGSISDGGYEYISRLTLN